VQEYLLEGGAEASVDPGPQDRQHGAVPLGSQELERRPDVFRGFQAPTDWSATIAQDPQALAP
jgi:hypothetical protein